MFTQKRGKFTVATTPEKTRPQQPKVRLEGKLTPAQLEAIAGGFTGSDSADTNHNQSVVSIKENEN